MKNTGEDISISYGHIDGRLARDINTAIADACAATEQKCNMDRAREMALLQFYHRERVREVVAAEREACAKLADEDGPGCCSFACNCVAIAIRKRSQPKGAPTMDALEERALEVLRRFHWSPDPSKDTLFRETLRENIAADYRKLIREIAELPVPFACGALKNADAFDAGLRAFRDAILALDPQQAEKKDAPQDVSAANVAPSNKKWMVCYTHLHKTLTAGDIVIMTETPEYMNVLLRPSDTTLHSLQGEQGEYVHLRPA